MYDSIVKEVVKMKGDADGIGKDDKQKPEGEEGGRLVSIINLSLPKTKSSSAAKSKNEAIIKQTQPIIRNQGASIGVFYTAQETKFASPMVEAVGWPLLATFSVSKEQSEDKPVVRCMEGFRARVHLRYALGMNTMRFTLVTSPIRTRLSSRHMECCS